MTAWFIVIVPLAIMLFALFMERVEARLRDLTVQENEVEEFLDRAHPDEVRALYGHGIGRALELFRRRKSKRSGARTAAPRDASVRPRKART